MGGLGRWSLGLRGGGGSKFSFFFSFVFFDEVLPGLEVETGFGVSDWEG